MGISIAQAEVLQLISRKSELNFQLMQLSNTLQLMQEISNEYISDIRSAQDLENEAIELAFDQEVECLADDDDYQQAYDEAYQIYLEEKEKTSRKFERMINDAQNEYQRKEASMELVKEQKETELEACDANIDAYKGLVEKNAKDEFSYFQST